MKIEQGDESAAAELVRMYLPEIRRAVRVRLTDPRLRRVLDSADVCQSVFANFFLRVSLGEYDLNRPEDLAALLIAMARNRLLDHVRNLQSQKRDQRRMVADGDQAMQGVVDSCDSPSRIVADRDLMAEVRRRMTTEELQLADLRAAGLDWNEIAVKLKGNPDSLRKKLTRAVDRITTELGLSQFQ